jgi:hypothetical protein
MIKRILDPEEFKVVAADIFELHEYDLEHSAHHFIRHNKESVIENFANKYLLCWKVFVWAHYNGEQWDAVILFIEDTNPMFGTKMFSEHIWLSKNPKVGYKLLTTALKFAKKKEFNVVVMSAVEKHPGSDKVKKFYKQLGFKKDSETYIAKL